MLQVPTLQSIFELQGELCLLTYLKQLVVHIPIVHHFFALMLWPLSLLSIYMNQSNWIKFDVLINIYFYDSMIQFGVPEACNWSMKPYQEDWILPMLYIYIYIITLLLSNTSMVLKKDSYLIIPIRCNSCCLKWVLIRTLFVSWHFLLWLEPGSILKNILSMKCLLREFRRCKDQTLFPVWFRYEVWLAK